MASRLNNPNSPRVTTPTPPHQANSSPYRTPRNVASAAIKPVSRNRSPSARRAAATPAARPAPPPAQALDRLPHHRQRAQSRHARPAPIGDLDANHVIPCRDGNSDHLAGKARSAVLHAVAEKLICQQNSDISARMPRSEHPADEGADDPCPLRPPGHRHALPTSRPSHQRTHPSPPASPRESHRAVGRTQGMHAQLSGTRQAGPRGWRPVRGRP
jgi:hypothetical protein